MKQFSCQRCDHKWIPRKDGKPVRCPKCTSVAWDKAKAARENGKKGGRPRKDVKQ